MITDAQVEAAWKEALRFEPVSRKTIRTALAAAQAAQSEVNRVDYIAVRQEGFELGIKTAKIAAGKQIENGHLRRRVYDAIRSAARDTP